MQTEDHPMIKVLLCEVHTLVRQALRGILKECAGVAIVGEASNGREAVACAAALKPDVVLLDISMPRLDGPEATTTIKQLDPRIAVIGLTAVDLYGMKAQAMRRAGATELMFKEDAVDKLCTSIVKAANTFRRPPDALAA
jgi:DNA-binding NarL/FixJ family response regulator